MKDELWMEVRAYPGQELGPANMEPLVNYALGTGEAFEFVAACMSSPRSERGRKVVRFFLKTPTTEALGALKNQLEGAGFYVVRAIPPDPSRFEYEAELQMAVEYPIGLFPTPSSRREFEELPDVAGRISSALVSGGMLWLSFKPDEGARRTAHRWARKRESPHGGGILWGFLEGFGREMVKGPRKDGTYEELEGSGRVSGPERTRRIEEAEEARKRAGAGLFSCDARLYGTPHQINSVLASIPTGANTLEVFRSRDLSELKEDEKLGPDPEPSTRNVRTVAKKAATVAPLLLLPVLWWLGLWNPLKAIDLITAHTLVLVGAVASSMYIFLRKEKNPVVLSAPELSTLVSLPQRIRRIPHEPGVEAEGPAEEAAFWGEGVEALGDEVSQEHGREKLQGGENESGR